MRSALAAALAAALLPFGPAVIAPASAAEPAAAAAQPLPTPLIVVVDLLQILRDTKAGKAVDAAISAQYSGYAKEVSAQEDELQKERTELERQRTILDPEVFNMRASDLQQRYDRLADVVNRRRQALQHSSDEARDKIKSAAIEAIAAIAAERKANLVIEKQAVLLEAEGLDITAEAIARVDQKLPSVPLNLPKPDEAQAAVPSSPPAGKKR